MAFLVALAASPLGMAADPLPDARDVLRLVRASEASQNRNLKGRLRMSTDDGNVVIPFRLLMRGSTVTYQFTDPAEALVLHLGANGSSLERVTGSGKTQKIAGARLDAPVRGTDVTYEDLALKFIYWNNAKVAGEQTVKTRACWLVQALPSSRDDSQYDMVRLWVEKSGALLKAECYSGGKLAKSFEVKKVQRAPEGGYMLKSLTVQRKGKATPTYLEVDPG